MALPVEVGLGPGHIVPDGDPATLSKRGRTPTFWPISIVAKRLDVSLGLSKGKRKEVYLYSAFIVATTLKALRRGSHSFTCK